MKTVLKRSLQANKFNFLDLIQNIIFSFALKMKKNKLEGNINLPPNYFLKLFPASEKYTFIKKFMSFFLGKQDEEGYVTSHYIKPN